MPLIEPSTYRPPRLARGPHIQTIWPSLLRSRIAVPYQRQILELPDDDFVAIDWLRSGRTRNPACWVIVHGLEGDSRSSYVRSAARSFARNRYDVAAFNLRGCGAGPNRQKRFYHSGDTGDLRQFLSELEADYPAVFVCGFSLGGNLALKLASEDAAQLSDHLRGVVAISAPCDLRGSAEALARTGNRLYMGRFIRLLARKLEAKSRRYREFHYPENVRSMRSFQEFDDAVTAPLNGYDSAEAYWRDCSALGTLETLHVPGYILAARNDCFLSEKCFPAALAEPSDTLFLEAPAEGGHCGFPSRSTARGYWHEERALEFAHAIMDRIRFR